MEAISDKVSQSPKDERWLLSVWYEGGYFDDAVELTLTSGISALNDVEEAISMLIVNYSA